MEDRRKEFPCVTLADSGWSQCFAETFLIKEAQCGQVYGLHISSGDSRVVVSVLLLGGREFFSRKRKTKVRVGVVEDRRKEFP